jgi:hypothetical protein
MDTEVFVLRPLYWEPSYVEAWIHQTIAYSVEGSIDRFVNTFDAKFGHHYGIFKVDDTTSPVCIGIEL